LDRQTELIPAIRILKIAAITIILEIYMRNTLLALVCASSFIASTAHSADHVRPGLWEITTTSELLRLAPQLSPDSMDTLKDLAEKYGVDMPQIQKGAATSQVCISQETANSNELPIFYQKELGCSTKNATRNGNKYRLDFVCSSSQLKGNGTAEGTFASPVSFLGRTHFEGVAHGIPVDEQADISGRWLGSSCGELDPL
jgi:hypothetical protein